MYAALSLEAVFRVDRTGARFDALRVSDGRGETGIVVGGRDVAVLPGSSRTSALTGVRVVGFAVGREVSLLPCVAGPSGGGVCGALCASEAPLGWRGRGSPCGCAG